MKALAILAALPLASYAAQMSFSADQSAAAVDKTWEALGPFPLGTRELPYLSSPLAAFTRPGQTEEDLFLGLECKEGQSEWPSSLAVDGKASWARFKEDNEGWVTVEWEHIDWKQIRRTEGWAGLQYLTLLRTTLHIDSKTRLPVNLDLTQAHSFAIVPKNTSPAHVAHWHTGDIYAYSSEQAPDGGFPSKLAGFVDQLEPGEYWVMVRGLFEIRMFGDPQEKSPKIKFRFGAHALSRSDAPTILGVDDAQVGLPDVVDGRLFGSVGGVAIRAGDAPIVVDKISLVGSAHGLAVSRAPRPVTVQPYQTRPLSFVLWQTSAMSEDIESITLRVEYSSSRVDRHASDKPDTLDTPIATLVELPVHHRKHWSTSAVDYAALRYTFVDYDGTVQYAMALPPLHRSDGGSKAVILATHGAGVETSSPFWTEALGERRDGLGWVVFATGKTPWGYDWHGPSAEHTFAAKDALADAVDLLGNSGDDGRGWGVGKATMLVGHSNGGQGATYLMERYPDRFIGTVAAAGYLKIQSYVAFTQWASSHHVDPSLWGILQSSLTSFDNDLHASNAAHVPFMLVHGTEDENVPVWHSRELKTLVDGYTANTSSVLLQEVANRTHWFDGIVSSPEVRSFLDDKLALTGPPQEAYWKHGFTLTVSSVDESGSKGGWKVTELEQPGRLARVKVSPLTDDATELKLKLKTTNVRRLSFSLPSTASNLTLASLTGLHIDSTVLDLPTGFSTSPHAFTFFRPSPSAPWRHLDTYVALCSAPRPRVSGPIIRILTSHGPLILVVPSLDPSHELDIAKRIAHDAFLYARLDAEIISNEEALDREALDGRGLDGSLVVIGGGNNEFGRRLNETPIAFHTSNTFTLSTLSGNRTFDAVGSPSTGLLSLTPHPTNPFGLALHLAGTDAAGLERAYRMFPVRTGTPLPDWLIIGPEADWKSAGGIEAAGFWGPQWEYNPGMSWTSD